MKKQALSNDFRLSIFASFYRVGFDLHDLTPNEKQRMEIIQLYPYLKNGEIWLDIQQELKDLVRLPFNMLTTPPTIRTYFPQVMTVIGSPHQLKRLKSRLTKPCTISNCSHQISARETKRS